MPRNPFIPIDQSERINRNGVDLSERRLFTSDFGRIVPFFTKEVLSGDSFEIDASCGLRSMPTLFPIQTRIRMSMEFYYCRNRCVWEDFEDFIFNTKKNLVQPWLKLDNERAKTMISTGSLGDFFRVPTTYALDSDVHITASLSNLKCIRTDRTIRVSSSTTLNDIRTIFSQSFNAGTPLHFEGYNASYVADFSSIGYISDLITSPFPRKLYSVSLASDAETARNQKCFLMLVNSENVCIYIPIECFLEVESYGQNMKRILYTISETDYNDISSFVKSYGKSYKIVIGSYLVSEGSTLKAYSPYFPSSPTISDIVPNALDIIVSEAGVLDATDDRVIDSNPFVGEQPAIPLNALPFRHYEMLMNYYYRNDKNNPYVLNGVVEYNKFIPSKSSGADTNVYDFHYRNFELDQFTSAVQSPQFGEAPLVGLAYNRDGETATLRFQATNVGTGVTSDYDVTVGLENDGRISSIVDFDKDVPSANLRKLQEDINAGISINSLRMGNAFQRFLENTYRGSLRYRNQLKSHRGVEVDYPDIDIPQYIGGASDYLESGQVNSTAATESTGLGDFNGFISGGVSTKNKIRIYCPENGFIIGVVSFYPIPMYCQNLEKVMQKTSWLDYQQTEFDKIGFVPMHYSEVFPLQTPEGGSVQDVFAYQKAWYEYMRSYDSVHGDFRTSLRDFTLMRTFKERPLMSQSFTKVYPEQFNDIFATRNIADDKGSSAKFMLSSNVQCIAQRQISVFGSPALE